LVNIPRVVKWLAYHKFNKPYANTSLNYFNLNEIDPTNLN